MILRSVLSAGVDAAENRIINGICNFAHKPNFDFLPFPRPEGWAVLPYDINSQFRFLRTDL